MRFGKLTTFGGSTSNTRDPSQCRTTTMTVGPPHCRINLRRDRKPSSVPVPSYGWTSLLHLRSSVFKTVYPLSRRREWSRQEQNLDVREWTRGKDLLNLVSLFNTGVYPVSIDTRCGPPIHPKHWKPNVNKQLLRKPLHQRNLRFVHRLCTHIKPPLNLLITQQIYKYINFFKFNISLSSSRFLVDLGIKSYVIGDRSTPKTCKLSRSPTRSNSYYIYPLYL